MTEDLGRADVDGLVRAEPDPVHGPITGLVWRGCTLEGLGGAYPAYANVASRGMDLRDLRSSQIRDVHFRGFSGSSLRVLDDSRDVLLADIVATELTRRLRVNDAEAQIYVRPIDLQAAVKRPTRIRCERCTTRGTTWELEHRSHRGIFYMFARDSAIVDPDVEGMGGNGIAVGGSQADDGASERVAVTGGSSSFNLGSGVYFFNGVVDSSIDGIQCVSNQEDGIRLGGGTDFGGRNFRNRIGQAAAPLLYQNRWAGVRVMNSNEPGYNVITAYVEHSSTGFAFYYSPKNTLVNATSQGAIACARDADACPGTGVLLSRGSSIEIDGGVFRDGRAFGIGIECDGRSNPQFVHPPWLENNAVNYGCLPPGAR